MTKEKFCKILNKVKDTWDLERNVSDLLWEYGRKHDKDMQEYGIYTPLIDEVINLLAEIMQDEDEDISYFCWEIDFGREWTENSIVDGGRIIDISTPEKLYDYLKEKKKK